MMNFLRSTLLLLVLVQLSKLNGLATVTENGEGNTSNNSIFRRNASFSDKDSEFNIGEGDLHESAHRSLIQSKNTYEMPSSDFWCPKAKCSSSPVCDLCDNYHLFIIAIGRSGSTTILDALNVVPGLVLSGETNNIFEGFEMASKRLESLHCLDEVKGAFAHHPFRMLDVECHYRMIYDIFNSVDSNDVPSGVNLADLPKKSRPVRGGKEVHVLTEGGIHFLKKLFPCSRMIFNYRTDFDKHQTSQYMDVYSIDEIKEMNLNIHRLSKLYPESSYEMIMPKDFDEEGFNKLLYWLGFRDCSFAHIPHSNNKGYKADLSAQLNASCSHVFFDFSQLGFS